MLVVTARREVRQITARRDDFQLRSGRKPLLRILALGDDLPPLESGDNDLISAILNDSNFEEELEGGESWSREESTRRVTLAPR